MGLMDGMEEFQESLFGDVVYGMEGGLLDLGYAGVYSAR